MSEKLSQIFLNVCSKYSNDTALIREYWNEIEHSYSQKNRPYHNLQHLVNMIDELQEVNENITDVDSILFSIFYHDIVYKSTAKDNEEKSAEIAKIRLHKINVDLEQIDKICNQILATKSHEESDDSDTNYLLDFDLAILGKNWIDYERYTKQVRKEYLIYPDFMYNPGRKKVLKHFLTFDKIFKTAYFHEKYEKQARQNTAKEIDSL